MATGKPTPTAPTLVAWTDVTDKLYGPSQSAQSSGWSDTDPSSLSYQAAQRRAGMAAGQDIPSNSPLGQGFSTPGYLQSAARASGIPTSMNSYLMGSLPPGVQMGAGLASARSVPDALQAVMPLPIATMAQQIGERNWGGLAGSLTPLIATLAMGRFGGPVMEGPMGRGLKAAGSAVKGGAAETFLNSAPLGVKLPFKGMIEGAKASWAKSAPKSAPVASAMDTLKLTDPAQLPAIPGAGRAPIPASTAQGPLPPPPDSWTNAAYGDAPKQPLIQPKKLPSEMNLPNVLKKRTDIPNSPANAGFSESYVPKENAQPGSFLDAKQNVLLSEVSKDGRTATLLIRSGGKITRKTLPIR